MNLNAAHFRLLCNIILLLVMALWVLPSGAVTLTEYAPITGQQKVLIPGPDGNLWGIAPGTNQVSRITPTGTQTGFTPLTANADLWDIVVGPDGNLWFTEFLARKIGKITRNGAVTEYDIPNTGVVQNSPRDLVVGPVSKLWFIVQSDSPKLGSIETDGTLGPLLDIGITGSTLPPSDLTVGPDGNFWYVSLANDGLVGQVTPSGTMTTFPIPTSGGQPSSIIVGADGNLWFNEPATKKIGRVTTAGDITEFSLPVEFTAPGPLARGTDGNIWFTDSSASLGRITPAGDVTRFPTPSPTSLGLALPPEALTRGPDGNLWFYAGLGGGRVVKVTDATFAVTTYTLSAATYSANENGGIVRIGVNRGGDTSGNGTVRVETNNGGPPNGAVGGSDYAVTQLDFSFLPGVAERTFDIDIVNDSAVEGNETLTVTLSNPSPGDSLGAITTATVTIVDDEGGSGGGGGGGGGCAIGHSTSKDFSFVLLLILAFARAMGSFPSASVRRKILRHLDRA